MGRTDCPCKRHYNIFDRFQPLWFESQAGGAQRCWRARAQNKDLKPGQITDTKAYKWLEMQ